MGKIENLSRGKKNIQIKKIEHVFVKDNAGDKKKFWKS